MPYRNKKILVKNNFEENTRLEDVLALYYLDTDLRSILSRVLGILEVAIRTSICEKMSLKTHDAHWYTKASSYDIGKFQAVFEDAAKQVNFNLDRNISFGTNPTIKHNTARHLFLDHYYDTYNPPALPPAWMLRECASFGFWAKTYEALTAADRKQITQSWRYFDDKKIDEEVFGSWLRSLTILRNRCSHHARITNRSFPFEPAIPKNSAKDLFESKTDDLRTLMSIILILTKNSLPAIDWRADVLKVFNDHQNVDIEKATGFKKDNMQLWEETKFWTFS